MTTFMRVKHGDQISFLNMGHVTNVTLHGRNERGSNRLEVTIGTGGAGKNLFLTDQQAEDFRTHGPQFVSSGTDD